MPYEHIENITRADIAFRISGNDLEEIFLSGAEALLSVMIEDSGAVASLQIIKIELANADIDLLLFEFLQELIFYKDAENLILLPEFVKISKPDDLYMLKSELYGEPIDNAKHRIKTDIKAVTMHKLSLVEIDGRWEGTFVLDV